MDKNFSLNNQSKEKNLSFHSNQELEQNKLQIGQKIIYQLIKIRIYFFIQKNF